MPVLILVGQVLGVSSDFGFAFLTSVGKQVLVALDAVRVLLTQDVAVTCQRLLAVPAHKMLLMEVLLHGFGVFTTED